MKINLTVTIEKEEIAKAKEYAKETGLSLSDLVENYFKLLTKDERKSKANQLSPRVKRLRGVLESTKTLIISSH